MNTNIVNVLHQLVNMNRKNVSYVVVPYSKSLEVLLQVLIDSGYLTSMKTYRDSSTGRTFLHVYLRYLEVVEYETVQVPVTVPTLTAPLPPKSPSKPKPSVKAAPSPAPAPVNPKNKNKNNKKPDKAIALPLVTPAPTQTPPSSPSPVLPSDSSALHSKAKHKQPQSQPQPQQPKPPKKQPPLQNQNQPSKKNKKKEQTALPAFKLERLEKKVHTPSIRGVQIFKSPGKPSLTLRMPTLFILSNRPNITYIVQRSNGMVTTVKSATKLRRGGTILMSVW